MDSAQCRSAVCERLLTQILRLLTWLEPESTQALTWYLCFTLFECLDPDLPFFCICSPHCRRHLDEQIMALLRITIRATVRVVEADRTFSARPFFYFRLGNTRAILQTVSAPLLEMCARVQGVRESSPLQLFQSANVFAGLVSTALRLRYQARVLHLDIAFNAITYQRGPRRVFPTSARTMHSAGSQLPRRPCPAARPTTTHPTQGSTATGIRATPAAALSETPEIASQAAPPPLPRPYRSHRSRRHRHSGGLDAALVRPGTDFNRSCPSPRHPPPPFPSGQRTPAVREPKRHQFALPNPPLFASGQFTPAVREPSRHQFAPPNPPLFPSGQRTPTVREPNRHQSAPPNPADSPDGPDARLQRPFAELAAGRVTVGLVWFEN